MPSQVSVRVACQEGQGAESRYQMLNNINECGRSATRSPPVTIVLSCACAPHFASPCSF